MSSDVRVVLLGKQGAGKGTQAGRVAAHYEVPHISTGDMFRAAAAAGTPFGRRAAEYMENGFLLDLSKLNWAAVEAWMNPCSVRVTPRVDIAYSPSRTARSQSATAAMW